MSMECDDVEACSSISDDFNVPGTSQSCSDMDPADVVTGFRQVTTSKEWVTSSQHKERRLGLDTQAQKICRRRKPVRILRKLEQDSDPTFPKRMMTTIHEEKVVCWHMCEGMLSSRQMRIYNQEPIVKRFQMSTLEYYKKTDKVRRMVSRLKQMADTKPEMLQDTLPDETIKLFKSIHIK